MTFTPPAWIVRRTQVAQLLVGPGSAWLFAQLPAVLLSHPIIIIHSN
ncbi:hypothetical protein [Superficieibacter sp. 1612_C1]|nr:hypothetical protein [Superficieibacter sp. 1612_C1]